MQLGVGLALPDGRARVPNARASDGWNYSGAKSREEKGSADSEKRAGETYEGYPCRCAGSTIQVCAALKLNVRRADMFSQFNISSIYSNILI